MSYALLLQVVISRHSPLAPGPRNSRAGVFYSSPTMSYRHNVMWYYVFHVSFILSTGPRNSRAGCTPGPRCSRAGGIVSLFLLQARGIRGWKRIGPRNSRAGKYGHSSVHSSFPPGPRAGVPVRLTVVPGQRLPDEHPVFASRGGLPPDACECAKVAVSTYDVCRIGLRRARESRKITGVRGIGIEPDRTEPNTRDGLRNRGLHAVPSMKLPAAPGRGKLCHPSTRVTSCKSGRDPRTVPTPLTPPHSGV